MHIVLRFLQRPTDQSFDTYLTSAQIFAAANDIIRERAWDLFFFTLSIGRSFQGPVSQKSRNFAGLSRVP